VLPIHKLQLMPTATSISCRHPNATSVASSRADPAEAHAQLPAEAKSAPLAGVLSQLEKKRLVKKLRGARLRKRQASRRNTLDGRGKCEGRRAHAEKRPEVVRRRSVQPNGQRIARRSESGEALLVLDEKN
jgi:hypothetical protein